jgi:hypothetical protein
MRDRRVLHRHCLRHYLEGEQQVTGPKDLDLSIAKDMIRKLLAAVETKDAFLVCYRIGTRPSEALFKRGGKAEHAVKAAKQWLESAS